MILASETISRRRNLPVKLQYITSGNDLQSFYWFVEHSTSGGTYFDNFEEVKEYIQAKKLLTPKQLERVEGIKNILLKTAQKRIEELQHIEAIRSTPEYKEAKRICEIRQQLKYDGVANGERDANKLIELHYLKEIEANLYEIMQTLQEK